jgi:hypothetical protein
MCKYLYFVLCLCFLSCSTNEEKLIKSQYQLSSKKDYIGKWKVWGTNPDRTAWHEFYIILYEDGSAEDTWEAGEKGAWVLSEDKVVIIWNNGWKEIIHKKENGQYEKLGYAPKVLFNEPPTNTSDAVKISN